MASKRTKTRISEWAIVLLTAGMLGTSLMQWWIVRATLRTSERPWIYAECVQGSELTVDPIPEGLTFRLQNAGRGPALNLWLRCITFTMRDVGHATRHSFPAPFLQSDLVKLRHDLEGRPTVELAVLPGGRDHAFFRAFGKDVPNIDLVRSKFETLYFYGECRYTDVFGRSFTMTFCHYFDPDKGEWRGAPIGNTAE